jgi:hypothetical protein
LRPGIPQTNFHWKHPPASLSFRGVMTLFDFAQKGLLIDVPTGPTTALALGNGPLLSTTLSCLSSRAKPRDLQFRGPLLEMFLNRAQRSLRKEMILLVREPKSVPTEDYSTKALRLAVLCGSACRRAAAPGSAQDSLLPPKQRGCGSCRCWVR